MGHGLTREPCRDRIHLWWIGDLGQVTQVWYPEPCIQHDRSMLVYLRHPHQVGVDACQLQPQFDAAVPRTQGTNPQRHGFELATANRSSLKKGT
jgi:hypothetical protein